MNLAEFLKARSGKHPSDAVSPPGSAQPPDELVTLRARLAEIRQGGAFDADIDGAYWTADRALGGVGNRAMALDYARDVVARYAAHDVAKPAPVVSRGISKEEHDAMLGREPQRSLSKEEYDRMIAEAQNG